jgi:hypothetical protein
MIGVLLCHRAVHKLCNIEWLQYKADTQVKACNAKADEPLFYLISA